MTEFDDLKLRLITDGNFRKRFLDDTDGALRDVGIEPTQELRKVLEKLRKDLIELVRILELEIESV